MGLQKVNIGRVQAQFRIEAGLVGLLPLNGAVRGHLQPLRFLLRCVVVPLDRRVDGYPNIAGTSRFDLLCEQVALQARVAPFRVCLGLVENHAVMAPGKTGDRVNVSVDQLLRPSRSIKFATYIGKLLAGVKVQVNLSVAEEVGHGVVCSCLVGSERASSVGQVV